MTSELQIIALHEAKNIPELLGIVPAKMPDEVECVIVNVKGVRYMIVNA